MKDGVHLISGVIDAVLAILLYIFGWSALQRCFGVEVQRVAPDGANIITLDVDERGNVMGERSTLVYVPQKYIPQSGDRVAVGDFDYIMVSVADWERLTNAVARLEAVAERRWTKEHQTAEGRKAWHGAETNRVVSADGRSVTWLYADGYAHTEQAAPARRASPAVKRTQSGQKPPQSARKAAGGTGLPPRLEAKRRALEARPKAKEVNATFGAGGKVLKVEEVK